VREAEAALGPITILINNAGIARTQGLDEVTEADWDELIDVNLKSAFFVSQAVLPAMRAARWGRIINISSTAAHVGGVVGPHYAASKAGLIGLTHFFASRLARDGITVNAIAPALVRTDMLIQDLKASAERIPVGRFGTPTEVASIVLSLVQNAYVTGQTISVNGGIYMT
jgi:3-oxoacyl-[acyl-carrier protein] reductase